MKAIIFGKNLSLQNVEEPKIKKNTDVKIKVNSVGLCGSDLHKILGGEIPSNYLKTNVLGHEVSGTIVEIGLGVSSLKVNDRVCVEPIFPKKYNDNYQFFTDTQFLGRDIQGAFSEYIVVPEKSVFKISPTLDFDLASLTDVVAVALHGINRCIKTRGNIAIIGDGPIALAAIVLIRILSLSDYVICIGRSKEKLKIAKLIGANSAFLSDEIPENMRDAFNVVFEAVGGSQSETLKQAIFLSKPQAIIGVFGVFSSQYLHNLFLRPAFYKELSILGLNSYSTYNEKREFKEALNLIEKNKSLFLPIITHKVPLTSFEDIINGIRNKSKDSPVKVIFNP